MSRQRKWLSSSRKSSPLELESSSWPGHIGTFIGTQPGAGPAGDQNTAPSCWPRACSKRWSVPGEPWIDFDGNFYGKWREREMPNMGKLVLGRIQHQPCSHVRYCGDCWWCRLEKWRWIDVTKWEEARILTYFNPHKLGGSCGFLSKQISEMRSIYCTFSVEKRFVGHLTSSGELPHDAAPPKMQDLLLLDKITSRKVVWKSLMAILW